MRVAERMSATLEGRYSRRMREALLGPALKNTVGRLLERLHTARQEQWRPTYKRDQDRFRLFWTEKLGAATLLTDVSPELVEEVVRRSSTEAGWSPATRNRYKRYLVDSFSFAERKAKLIDPKHNLSAVDFEDPASKGRAFTVAELQRLLPALEAVDVRAGWLGHVLWQTGRRLTAARTLKKEHVQLESDHAVIFWPLETDKAGKEGASVVVGRALELARVLHRKAGRYMTGKAPAELDLCEKDWFPAAEKAAGIKHVDGRAWHGIKRRYSSETKGLIGRDKQSGTLEATLRSVYEQDDDLDAKSAVAKRLAERVAVG